MYFARKLFAVCEQRHSVREFQPSGAFLFHSPEKFGLSAAVATPMRAARDRARINAGFIRLFVNLHNRVSCGTDPPSNRRRSMASAIANAPTGMTIDLASLKVSARFEPDVTAANTHPIAVQIRMDDAPQSALAESHVILQRSFRACGPSRRMRIRPRSDACWCADTTKYLGTC